MKKLIIGILAVLLALVTLFSLTVFICNNTLAKKQAERLLACELPRSVRLLDSASFAGKRAWSAGKARRTSRTS